jgi:hypothetical protein
VFSVPGLAPPRPFRSRTVPAVPTAFPLRPLLLGAPTQDHRHHAVAVLCSPSTSACAANVCRLRRASSSSARLAMRYRTPLAGVGSAAKASNASAKRSRRARFERSRVTSRAVPQRVELESHRCTGRKGPARAGRALEAHTSAASEWPRRPRSRPSRAIHGGKASTPSRSTAGTIPPPRRDESLRPQSPCESGFCGAIGRASAWQAFLGKHGPRHRAPRAPSCHRPGGDS